MARVAGVDVARGVASLLMIQGHAYHGWVAPEHRGAAYAFTRFLGTLPLPAFLVLAGASVTFRLEAAARRRESNTRVRRGLVQRGLQVLLFGYLFSAVCALVDGATSASTWLRSDVLHVIGLSIAIASIVGLSHGDETVNAHTPHRFAARAGLLALLISVLCPWLSTLGQGLETQVIPAAAAALFVDVPGFTRMPWVPLFAWFAIGAMAARLMQTSITPDSGSSGIEPASPTDCKTHSAFAQIAGASRPRLLAMLLGAVAISLVCFATMHAAHRALGGQLSRAHPAILFNILDLGARGVAVLATAALVCVSLPGRFRTLLCTLGRGSLLAYMAHLPFCYGTLAGPWSHQLTMAQASLGVLMLGTGSLALVVARDRMRRGRHDRSNLAPEPAMR